MAIPTTRSFWILSLILSLIACTKHADKSELTGQASTLLSAFATGCQADADCAEAGGETLAGFYCPLLSDENGVYSGKGYPILTSNLGRVAEMEAIAKDFSARIETAPPSKVFDAVCWSNFGAWVVAPVLKCEQSRCEWSYE